MTADDIWGHEYIDANGKSHDEKMKPFDWMIHIYYKENDGYAFMRKGPQRLICLRINPLVELQEAKEAFENYKTSKHGFDTRTAKNVFSELERMIKNGEKDSEINY